MNTFRLSHLARADLAQIHDYIARNNPAAAFRQVDVFFGKFQTLADQPLIGQLREDLRANLRTFSAGNYVICYLAEADGVEVVRVLHGARDIEALFHEG